MKMSDFKGTGALARLILRRDWLPLLIWILFILILAVSFAASFIKLYPTLESRQLFMDQTANSAAEVLLIGKVLAPSLGAITAWRFTIASFILVGLGSLIMVIRHTRTEEEQGRRELLSSAAIGKHSPLAAALAVTFAADLVIGILVSAGLIGLGLPAAGSVALGFSVTIAGWLIGAVAGVAAQLTESARTAQLITGAVIIFAYIMKILADVDESSWINILKWLSPMGLMQNIRPYAGERWWIFVVFIAATAIIVAVAYVLSSKRDLGAGLLPERPGPASAAPGLRSTLALAWRLQKGTLFALAAFIAVLGLALGLVAKIGADQMAASPQMAELFARIGGNAGFGDILFTVGLALFAEAFAIYAIMATLRLGSEEDEMHVDLLLAGPVDRIRWALGHLSIAVLGSALLLVVYGLTTGFTYGLTTGDVSYTMPRVLAASLAYLPAILVMAGIAMLLFGWLPRYTALAWVALAACILIDLASEFKLADQVVLNISPFVDTPKLMIGDGSIWPLAALLVVAAALMALGLIGFRRRDIS